MIKTFYFEKSLGMDIREESICLTLLGKSFYQTDVLAAKFISIQNLESNNEQTESKFLEIVNRFMMENEAWVENVVVSIPRSKFTLQSFELPAPDRKSVDSMMKFELERHFSSDVDSFYYSNHITAKDNNQYHIVCAAIKKEVANQYIHLLDKLNLKATILDVSTFANINLTYANEDNSESPSVLLDLSLNFIDISIINKNSIEFSTNIPINDPEYKKAYLSSDIKQQNIDAIGERITKSIIEEIQNALASCRNIKDSASVGLIKIVGGGNFATKITKSLEKATGVQTNKTDLPTFINTQTHFSMEHMGTSLALAIRGLKQSIININLLPENLKISNNKKINIKTTAALALITILLIVGYITNKNIHDNKTLASLDKQLEHLKIEIGPLEKVDLEYQLLQKYMSTLNRIEKIYPTKLPILMELSQIIPKDTWLKKIHLKKEIIKINGVSKSASRLLPIVENSNYFSDTSFVGTIVTDSGGEKFTIKSVVGFNK